MSKKSKGPEGPDTTFLKMLGGTALVLILGVAFVLFVAYTSS